MIFRRRQDEMEGFRRMREALRQQADPQDHALLDEQLDEQYESYEEGATLVEEDELTDDELLDDENLEEFESYVEPRHEVQPVESLTGALAPLQPGEQPAAPHAQVSNASMTTIGADTSWSGTLRSESNIYLEGKVEGTIEARDTIYIAERATIDARLKAYSVVVSGHLAGHIDCEGRLEVTPTGRLNGEATAGSLVVHDGAILDGKFKMKNSMAASGQ